MYQQVQQHRFCSTKEMLYITTVLETPKLHAHLVLRRDLLFGQVSNSTDCFLEEVYSQFWISLHSIGHYYQLSHPQNRSAGLNCCPSCNVERPKVNPIGECPSPPVPSPRCLQFKTGFPNRKAPPSHSVPPSPVDVRPVRCSLFGPSSFGLYARSSLTP